MTMERAAMIRAAAQVIEYLRQQGPADAGAREICRQLTGRIARVLELDPARSLREGGLTQDRVEEVLERLSRSDHVTSTLIRKLDEYIGGSATEGWDQQCGERVLQVSAGDHGVAVGRGTAVNQGIAVGGNVVGGNIVSGSTVSGSIVGGNQSWGRADEEGTGPADDRGDQSSRPLRDPPPAEAWAEKPSPELPSQPDLELTVGVGTSGSRPELTLELRAPRGDVRWEDRRFGPYPLHADLAAYVGELFEALSHPAVRRQQEAEAQAIGADLCRQLVPPELADLLWTLRSRCRSLLLKTEEPWLPWELVLLPDPDGGPGGFLCEAFDMTRWPVRRPPPLTLPLRRIAAVIAGEGDPISVGEELEDLLRHRRPSRTISTVEAELESLLDAMAEGSFDGWHFSGHGLAPKGDANLAAITLDDHSRFTPKHLSGKAFGLGRTRPLVFFNGCHTGRGGFTLTSAGGWAHQFLNTGASAFVGAFWSIPGDSAAIFARAFYDRFFDGVPLGAAARAARLVLGAARPHDVARLAYTVYGHPLASVDGNIFDGPQ